MCNSAKGFSIASQGIDYISFRSIQNFGITLRPSRARFQDTLSVPANVSLSLLAFFLKQ